MGDQRVVILPKAERTTRRAEVVRNFVEEFGLSDDQSTKIETLKLPSGWEPYSVEALRAMLPHLEKGVRFGELVMGPDWEDWRAATFPGREQPTANEVFDRLPSPAEREERDHIASLRNPTVARTRNELRKVVNNLIDLYGKPDLIRVEVARDVGNSKRQREEKASGRRQERRRKAAREALQQNGIAEPARADVEKWMLWEECGPPLPVHRGRDFIRRSVPHRGIRGGAHLAEIPLSRQQLQEQDPLP